MGIKTNLVDSKGEKLSELPSVSENSNKNSNANSNSITNTDKNSSSKKNRRRPKKMFYPIQKLYDTCKDVFTFGGTGVVPSPEKIDLLRSVLGMVILCFDWFYLFFFFFSVCVGVGVLC